MTKVFSSLGIIIPSLKGAFVLTVKLQVSQSVILRREKFPTNVLTSSIKDDYIEIFIRSAVYYWDGVEVAIL